MKPVRAHVVICGRVQGVNFRSYAHQQARAAGVVGWVRNLDDGRVEAEFEGSRDAVERLVNWCYSGPSNARVEKVDIQWIAPSEQEKEFSIQW